jgi:hypothetical protein
MWLIVPQPRILLSKFVRDFVAECNRQNCLPKSHDPRARALRFSREDASDVSFQLSNAFGV